MNSKRMQSAYRPDEMEIGNGFEFSFLIPTGCVSANYLLVVATELFLLLRSKIAESTAQLRDDRIAAKLL